jgi:hypothetical protein
MKENRNLISGIVSVIILIILIQIEPLNNGDFFEILGVLVIFTISFFIVRFLLSLFIESETGEKIEIEIRNKKELEIMTKKVQYDIAKYQNAKNSFKYFSNEKLASIYKELEEKGIEDMERLALEEIMVEKGLLTHSKMHEKLHMIKKHFDVG